MKAATTQSWLLQEKKGWHMSERLEQLEREIDMIWKSIVEIVKRIDDMESKMKGVDHD